MAIQKRINNYDVPSLLQFYKNDCKIRGLTERTVEGYQKELLWILQDVSYITEVAINNCICKLVDSNLANASINHFIRTLRAFINWCAENNYIHPIKIATVRGQKPPIKMYTEEECRLLLSDYSKNNFISHRTHCIVAFVLACGARAATLLNIKISDVNFTTREILFAHLKNKQVFHCPMTAALEKELRTYLQTWQLPQDGYLFCDYHGNALTYNAMRQSFERLCARVGVECRGIHGLRHTFSTEYIKNSGDVFSLSKILTHNSIQITQQYIHLANIDIANKIQNFAMLDHISKSSTKITKK